MAMRDPAAEGIRAVLLRLRTHAGLTAERLRTTEVDTSILDNLLAVRHEVDAGATPEAAIVTVIAGLARGLAPTDLLIADATLALGVLRGDAPPDITDRLYAPDLAQRREALVRHWDALHDLLKATPGKRPTVRGLRGSIEAATLAALADRCVGAREAIPSPRTGHETNSVVIVGSAVMDHIFVVGSIPAENTSTAAVFHESHPGGKGLNLAVAGNRMQLDARLVAVVGNDSEGREVLEYMRSEELPTDLIKEVPGARTPVTAVHMTDTGLASYVGWKNDTEIRRTRNELRALRPVLADASAVLVTFEPSFEEVRWALKTTSEQQHKPLLLVQPSPPMESPQQIYPYLSSVDYLVGSEWELRCLLPAAGPHIGFDDIVRQLLNLGVQTVCVVEQLTCRIRSRRIQADVRAPDVAMIEAPAAREAFSAALVYQLLNIGRDLNTATLEWAAAAMTANIQLTHIPESMPGPDEVENLMQANKLTEQA